MKALGLRPRAFISFLAFGNPDETLALVFEILHEQCWLNSVTFYRLVGMYTTQNIRPSSELVEGSELLFIC